jgi:hypothetical protein
MTVVTQAYKNPAELCIYSKRAVTKSVSSYTMNKALRLRLLLHCLFVATLFTGSYAQNKSAEPWTEAQLMPPAELATSITAGKNVPLIISIGPAAIIKGSIDIGSTGEKENLDKLKATLSKVPKDKQIVLYCGCCPFRNCPNIRPAFALLNQMKFTNHKLLNLATNIRVDWINKGYPMN